MHKPLGAYTWRGDFTEGFLRYEFEGLIFGGAYFRNFMVSIHFDNWKNQPHDLFTVVI